MPCFNSIIITEIVNALSNSYFINFESTTASETVSTNLNFPFN